MRAQGHAIGRQLLLAAGLFYGAGVFAGELRIGIIGCDTSHVTAFTETLNNPSAKGHVPGARVVAAYKGGSRDIPESWSRVEPFSATLREKYGIRFYDTIEELCQEVDAVMLESVDGRPHLGQMRAILRSQQPLRVDKGAELLLGRQNRSRPRLRVFIDKPMAASLRDALEIFRLAKAAGVPVFSSSALRYGKDTQAVRHGSLGKVSSVETCSPCHLEPHHPDLVWYGIHGAESLFTVLGTGCEAVRRESRPDGKIEVVGVWSGGRTGVFLENEQYRGLARGELGEAPVGSFDGYEPLLVEIVKFFQTGIAPVDPEETVEIFAFMEAADESKRQNGAVVKISDVLKKAKQLRRQHRASAG